MGIFNFWNRNDKENAKKYEITREDRIEGINSRRRMSFHEVNNLLQEDGYKLCAHPSYNLEDPHRLTYWNLIFTGEGGARFSRLSDRSWAARYGMMLQEKHGLTEESMAQMPPRYSWGRSLDHEGEIEKYRLEKEAKKTSTFGDDLDPTLIGRSIVNAISEIVEPDQSPKPDTEAGVNTPVVADEWWNKPRNANDTWE